MHTEPNYDLKIITIDGPSGSGKGTVATQLAHYFHYNLLDSGAIYRAIGLAALQAQHIVYNERDELTLAAGAASQIAHLALHINIQFKPVQQSDGTLMTQVFLNDENVSQTIRQEQIGICASLVGAIGEVRRNLFSIQRCFLQAPGLVADGRDMGTVIFPEAQVKIFLTSSSKARAERRLKQLQNQGMDGNLANILAGIVERDRRDSTRTVAPLQAPPDALVIDSTDLTVPQVVKMALQHCQQTIGSC